MSKYARNPYALITRAVDTWVAEHPENDPANTRYLIARAALVGIAPASTAARKAQELSEELTDWAERMG